MIYRPRCITSRLRIVVEIGALSVENPNLWQLDSYQLLG